MKFSISDNLLSISQQTVTNYWLEIIAAYIKTTVILKVNHSQVKELRK